MIMSILFFILASYILYKCFEKGGFKLGFIVVYICEIINMVVANGTKYIFFIIILGAVFSLIATAIEYFIYSKTSSFISYFIVSIIASLIIAVILTILILPMFMA